MPAIVKDTEAVPVHIVADSSQPRSIPTPTIPRERTSTTNSYVPTVGGLPLQILAHAPKRCRAVIIVNGSGNSVVALGGSQSDVQDAQNVPAGEFLGKCAYVIGTYQSEIEVESTDELWAGLVTAGSSTVVISVLKEMDT